MKIIIIYDNTLYSVLPGLKSDWGFSACIEIYDRRILFDTGGNGRILLDNMKILGINPLNITDVFISHNHYDHVGGLSHFLNENKNIILHSPPSFRGVKYAKKVKFYKGPKKIHKGVYSSGEINGIEQSLAVETEKGLLVITGCSHPPMTKILSSFKNFGKITSIAGGFHDFSEFQLFSEMELISAMHCTGKIKEIKRIYPQQFTSGGVGKVIRL